MRPADRTLPEVRGQFLSLQREAGTLATHALRLRPTWKQVFSRKELHQLEERLNQLFVTFMNVDADLTAHASMPNDLNSAMRVGIEFQLHCGVRDSVRGVLTDTSAILNGFRNQLDFRSSLTISLLAVGLSVVGLAVGCG